MKKLFVFLMVVGMVIAGRGMASATLSWSMPDTLSVTPGSAVTVPVYMSVDPAFDLGAISLSILYDSSKFDYVRWDPGTWGSLDILANVPDPGGNFRAASFYYPLVPFAVENGTLLTFTLQAKTDAPSGVSALTFDTTQGSNEVAGGEDFTPVALVLTNGSINVSESAVPIPAAVWLLGSGLIGLVGIRRKFSK